MTAAHSSGSQLTVSRIHRLLRPLRNKCANLASLSTSRSGSSIITYASRANSTAWTDDLPPLETIPRPRVILMRLDLRTKYQTKLALSQKVWDVLDTFENILQAAFGKQVPKGKAGRMLTLTEMCAAVVGENLQEEIAREEEDCEDRDGGEEEAGLAVVNELYEAIPEDLRRWMLVTHAITIILEICPHHPTLLISLLTQTMKRGLARDSQTLLYALLSVAIGARRSSIYPTPICHPSHASYLQDLSETWTATGSAYFSQRTFIHILADVLCETESPHVWKCKALSRCTRSIRSTDFPAFLYTVDTLIEVIGRIRSRRRTPRGKSPRSKAAPREHEELRVRLTKWFRSISDHPAFDPDTTDASTEEYQAIVSSVVRARHWGIHLCSADADASTDPTTIELPSALVCLAVQCLSAPLFSTLGPADSSALAGLLRDVHPATSTCDELVQQHFAAGPDFAGVMRALRGTAAALRAHALAALEASFWVCALRHFERDAGAARGERAQLMEAVSEAERLRFADGGGEGEWEWEEMIGCWVRRAPEVVDSVVRVQKLGGLATGRTRAAVPFRAGARTKPASVSSSSASSSRQSSSQQSSSSRGSKRSGASTPPTDLGESEGETSDGEWDPEEDPLLLSPRKKRRKIVHTPTRLPSVESSEEEESPQQAQDDYSARLPSEDGTSEEEGGRRRRTFKAASRTSRTRVVLTDDEDEDERPQKPLTRAHETLKAPAQASLFKGTKYSPPLHVGRDMAHSSSRRLVMSDDEEDEQPEPLPLPFTNRTRLIYSEDEDDDEPEEPPMAIKHAASRAQSLPDEEDGISTDEDHAPDDESDTLEGETDTYEPTQSQSDEGTADEEQEPPRPATHQERATKQRRRLSNFASLLKDAQRSVTDLRAERRASQSGLRTQVRVIQPGPREEPTASVASQTRAPPALPRPSYSSTHNDIQRHVGSRNPIHRDTHRPNTAATSISAEMQPHANPRKRQRRAGPPPRIAATGHPTLSQSRGRDQVVPASDDSLNLFAYSDT